MYEITCPNCGKKFQVEYKNDSTYCYCKFPYGDMVLVPDFDAPARAKRVEERVKLFHKLYPI